MTDSIDHLIPHDPFLNFVNGNVHLINGKKKDIVVVTAAFSCQKLNCASAVYKKKTWASELPKPKPDDIISRSKQVNASRLRRCGISPSSGSERFRVRILTRWDFRRVMWLM